MNDPHDSGGETNWGVTKRTTLENGYTDSMRAMSREQAYRIYEKRFGNASRMLQGAVGVADDGIFGNCIPISDFILKFNALLL